MKKIFDLLILIFLNNYIKANTNNCFEFSCEECETEEYGKCTKCRDSFVLVNGMCPCQDSKCALCNTGYISENSCVLCKNGFYNTNNDCYCNIENCQQCAENGCLKCNFGYYYDYLNHKCEKINCVDSNCELCYSIKENECYKCKAGYKLENGNCNTQYSHSPCSGNQYEESSYCYEKCDGLVCTQEFINKENAYNCTDNNCVYCENNKLYSYSNCENSEMCKNQAGDGCMVCKTDNICFECSIGYRNENGECKQCIEGCSICIDDNTCEYCLSGYQLTSDKICILTNNFDFNINVYNAKKLELLNKMYPDEYDDNNQIYKECDKNCLHCDDNTGKCIECKNDFILESNKCLYNKYCFSKDCEQCIDKGENSCIQCKAGKQLINGRCWNLGNNCQDLIPNCALCNGNDKCYACKADYFLEKNNTYCKKVRSYLFILYIFIVILSCGLAVLITYLIIQKKRRLRLEEEERRRRREEERENNINSIANTERLNLNNRKKKYEREFDRLENSDKKSTNDKEDNKSSSSDQNKCNICYRTDVIIKSFKCGCSFKVCKECYVQSKLRTNRCPQCRAVI